MDYAKRLAEVPITDRLVCPYCCRIINSRTVGTSSGQGNYAICTFKFCRHEFCRLCYLDFHGLSSCAAAWDAGKTMLSQQSPSYFSLSSAMRYALETKTRQVEEEEMENAQREKHMDEEDDVMISDILKSMESNGIDNKEIRRRKLQMEIRSVIGRMERKLENLHERLEEGTLIESEYKEKCSAISCGIDKIWCLYNNKMLKFARLQEYWNQNKEIKI